MEDEGAYPAGRRAADGVESRHGRGHGDRIELAVAQTYFASMPVRSKVACPVAPKCWTGFGSTYWQNRLPSYLLCIRSRHVYNRKGNFTLELSFKRKRRNHVSGANLVWSAGPFLRPAPVN